MVKYRYNPDAGKPEAGTNGSGVLICIMCPSLDGGWGRILVNLANEFTRRGYGVHFTVDDDSGSFTRFLDPGIEIFPLKTTHTLTGIPGFARYLLKNRPEIILTTVVRHTVLAVLVKKLTGMPVRIYPAIHNTYSAKFKDLSRSKYRSRIKKLSRYYPRCDRIIAVSEDVKSDFCALTGLPLESVVTIYNPIVDEELTSRSSMPIEHPWFESGQPPVILSAGRLEKAKNYPLLIRAFELVREKLVCRLLILGDGSQLGPLRSIARTSPRSGDISLPGYQENPYAYMARAALFVLSSSWEGLPTVLVEAMATGTPVVATDCPSGPREILMAGRYGPIVPMNDPESLAEAMVKTIRDPIPRGVLQERAAVFSCSSSADHYLRVLGLTDDE